MIISHKIKSQNAVSARVFHFFPFFLFISVDRFLCRISAGRSLRSQCENKEMSERKGGVKCKAEKSKMTWHWWRWKWNECDTFECHTNWIWVKLWDECKLISTNFSDYRILSSISSSFICHHIVHFEWGMLLVCQKKWRKWKGKTTRSCRQHSTCRLHEIWKRNGKRKWNR